MKPHYFNQDRADADDGVLLLAKKQGYVPSGCLLGGIVVMSEVNGGRDACAGCDGPRLRCGGRSREVKDESDATLPDDEQEAFWAKKRSDGEWLAKFLAKYKEW